MNYITKESELGVVDPNSCFIYWINEQRRRMPSLQMEAEKPVLIRQIEEFNKLMSEAKDCEDYLEYCRGFINYWQKQIGN